ncbi:MAG: hypothetical protein ACREN2_06065 [Candidatus Dormibacteria bacterium]
MADGEGMRPARRSPRTADTVTTQRSSSTDHVACECFMLEVQQLQSPRGRKLPWSVRRSLPNPYASIEQLQRLRHDDVPHIGADQARHELAVLAAAVADVDDHRDVPRWIIRRRAVLAAHLKAVLAAQLKAA